MTNETGKFVILIGALVVAVGTIIYFFHDKLHWVGNLPGDIKIKNGNFRFYFPLTTMILLSLLVNLLIRIFKWFN
jgi:hypothetical protein